MLHDKLTIDVVIPMQSVKTGKETAIQYYREFVGDFYKSYQYVFLREMDTIHNTMKFTFVY